MEIPIEGLIRDERLDVARLQDTVIEIIYNYVQPDAVLYGGTAIWRCYNGGRFSEDIDIYVNSSFGKRLEAGLLKQGIKVAWRDKELPLHMRLSDGNTEMLLEASVGNYESRISQYVRVDGSSMTIMALSPAELLVRKMEAYGGRRYIRDLYDIMHLTNYLDKNDHYIVSKLKPFLKSIKEPEDERVLSSLVYKGDKKITFRKMVEYLNRWVDR